MLAVATLWALSVGGAAEANLPASTLAALPPSHVAHRRASGRPLPRLLSCFRRGVLVLVIGADADAALPLPLPPPRFLPEPWPTSTPFDPKTYP